MHDATFLDISTKDTKYFSDCLSFKKQNKTKKKTKKQTKKTHNV